jgi:copper resistance protein B
MRRLGRLGAAAALAAALLGGASARPVSAQVMDQARYLFLYADKLEQAPGLPGRPLRLEGDAWYGGSWNRLWIKLDGDVATRGPEEGEIEAQALFSRLVSPYRDLQAGIRVDGRWGEGGRARPHLAVALQGLAPYWFEVESALFVSARGDVSGSLQARYDVLFTQRLILEPELDVGASLQDVPEWGVGAGITHAELGLRLRYEVRREFAPYVGYVWRRSFSGTADLLRTAGDPPRQGSLVAGVTMWH